MQRLIAIDCDSREFAYIQASVSGDRITIEAAAIVPLKSAEPDRLATVEEATAQLQAALAKYKRSGVKALVGVDRNAIELISITVPPSTDAELPEMVQNQLVSESPTIADESVIDFIPNPGDPAESRRITAATLPKTELQRVTTICNAINLTPHRILARPYETASLFLKKGTLGTGDSLLVNVIVDEVDLIVVDQIRPLFFRSVRLPGGLGDETAEQRVLDEIRRTLLVAPQNVEVGQVIESVYVFGTSPEHERLVQQIAKDCNAKVHAIDPFEGFTINGELENRTSGRLVPLLGMLAEEAHGAAHSIDFANPRKAPPPPNRVRQIAIGTAVAAALFGSIGYYVYESFAKLTAEQKQLTSDLADLTSRIKKSADKKKMAEAIEDWNGNSVIWLDELRDLSAKFPPGQDLVIQRLAMTPTRAGRASISFQGLARESKVVARMESALRDNRHEVQTPRIEERVLDKMYSWSFDTSIGVSPNKIEVDDLIEKKEPYDEPAEPKLKKKASKDKDKSESPEPETSKSDTEKPVADKSEPAASKTKKTSKSRTNAKKKSAEKEAPATNEPSAEKPDEKKPDEKKRDADEPKEQKASDDQNAAPGRKSE